MKIIAKVILFYRLFEELAIVSSTNLRNLIDIEYKKYITVIHNSFKLDVDKNTKRQTCYFHREIIFFPSKKAYFPRRSNSNR